MYNKLDKQDNKNLKNTIEDLTKKIHTAMMDGKESISSIMSRFLKSLIEVLEISRNEKFVYLLVGRTGVGKSSTINALMGQQVAATSRRKPTTMDVTFYDNEINGVSFTVIDTPGLCDDVIEEGNDYKYLELIRSKVNNIDLIWFVTPIYETRIRRDELDGIKIITEAFGAEIWKHSIIVFTFADKAEEDYLVQLQERTEDIQSAIAKYTGIEIASQIPSVAVDNKNETTPDGKVWLAELYTKVFVRMSKRGTIPFLLTTVKRLSFSSIFFTPASKWQNIELNENQKKEIKEKLFSVIPFLKSVCGKIGSVVGSVISNFTGVEEAKDLGKFTGEVIGEDLGKKVDDNIVHPTLKFFKQLFDW
nr:GTPase [Scytonema hofmannii]